MSTPQKRKSLDQINKELCKKKPKKDPQDSETQDSNLPQYLHSSDFFLSVLNQQPSTSGSVCPDVQNDSSNSGTSRKSRKQSDPKKHEKFEESEESEKSEKSETVKCLKCGKNIKRRKENLNVHIISHMGLKPFKCQHCSKWLATRSSLRQHYINRHSGTEIPKVKALMSPENEEKLQSLSEAYFPGIETRTSPVNCNKCKIQIQRNVPLYRNEHVFSHLNINPFICPECNYGSPTKRHIIQHMKLSCKLDGEPIFELSQEDKQRCDLLMEQCFPEYSSNVEYDISGNSESDNSGFGED
ncbi:hypothetical protein B9Z55_026785 [Caenorhabditis nigoni]|uniref:C2H2-type domain-containing protein n=1 Tax=Caenorhabditis nigoni TaxID=1611254 RepID=A0A2G5SHY3_9PELO|nr:hypothetical protein B9Z55_026785 [Caenorhabditis nigoni]